ncbi:MAG: RsmE family RNA methyltransferase [Flavipsychrobacter sp.]
MAKESLFFHDGTLVEGADVQLTDATSRHVLQVLRMQVGDGLELTNGDGLQAFTTIKEASKKKCIVHVAQVVTHDPIEPKIHLGISFTKNTSRNEWLLEKATELGIKSIIPIQSTRTERVRVKEERWKGILSAALIQSQQFYLPVLQEIALFEEVIEQYKHVEQKLIAHCMSEIERMPLQEAAEVGKETLILIGPEGDFTQDEVALSIKHGFRSISMGNQRLRTETAAIAACSFFNIINHV